MKIVLVFAAFAFCSSMARSQAANIKAAIRQPAILTFGDAYVLMQKRNLATQSQELNVETSRAKRLTNIGTFLPNLSLVGTDSHTASTINTSSANSSVRGAVATVGVNLFRSGSDFAALKAANRDIDTNQDLLSDQVLKAEDDSATTLVTFITKALERELISKIVGIKQESLKIARERYARGLLAAQEVDKTQIDLDNAQARLIDADVALADAKAAVTARLGTAQNVELQWPWKSAILSGLKPDVSSFNLEDRPDYRASLASVEAEDWRRHAARSALLPSIDFTASYGNFDLSQSDRRDWSTLLTLTIPIFENFKGWSAARVQTLAKEQAEIRREQIRRNAAAEIESLSAAYRAAKESAVSREKTAKVTQHLFTDNLQRFRMGRASADELSIDQNRLLDAQILEVEGWSTAHLSFVRLCHALGHSVLASGACDSF